jgi:hypothetical protein
MICRCVSDIIKGFASDRDYMRLAKFELFGCLETEGKALSRPTENSLPNLAPLRTDGNFSANGSYSVSGRILECDMNIVLPMETAFS